MLNRLRELTKSFGNQVEPERTEQLKRTKAEVEKNVTRILKLIKGEEQGKGKRKASKKETELVGLVQNLHKEFESLYSLCDNLLAESGKIAVGKNECGYSSDHSISDSEYYSSEEIGVNTAGLESEVAHLKNKLAVISEENKALRSKCDSALSKVQDVENVKNELKIEVDKKGREISALAKAKESNGKLSLARIKELEGQLRGKAAEAKQLGDKRKGWHSRVLELESVLKGKEDQNSVIVKKLEENEGKFVSRIEELEAERKSMKAEIDCLRAKKRELEEELEKGLAQVKELVDEKMERERAVISGYNEGSESEKVLGEKSPENKEEDDQGSSRVMDSTVQFGDWEGGLDFLEIKKREIELEIEAESQENAETPTTQMGNQHVKSRGKMGDKRNPLAVERKIEDLVETFRLGFEDKLSLLYQRIVATEHSHHETKAGYNEAREKLEKAKEASESAQTALNGLNSVVTHFEERNGQFSNQISRVANELKQAKTWVKSTTGEIKRLKHNVDCLVAYLEHKEEQEFLLRDKVWKLEAKASREGGEKFNLMQEVSQLEKQLGKYERLVKEKDERLASLGEEKREAIRQLCLSVDYHRSRVHHLKLVISKMRMSYGWREN